MLQHLAAISCPLGQADTNPIGRGYIQTLTPLVEVIYKPNIAPLSQTYMLNWSGKQNRQSKVDTLLLVKNLKGHSNEAMGDV